MKYYEIKDKNNKKLYFKSLENIKKYVDSNYNDFYFMKKYIFNHKKYGWVGLYENHIIHKVSHKYKQIFLVDKKKVYIGFNDLTLFSFNGNKKFKNKKVIFDVYDCCLHQEYRDVNTNEIIKTRNGYICIDYDMLLKDIKSQYCIITEKFDKYNTYEKAYILEYIKYSERAINFQDSED